MMINRAFRSYGIGVMGLLVVLSMSLNAHASCTTGSKPSDTEFLDNLTGRYYPGMSCEDLQSKFTVVPRDKPKPTADPTLVASPTPGAPAVAVKKPIPPFQFFRTAVPWYWDISKNDEKCAKSTPSAEQDIYQQLIHDPSFRGFCAGDVHAENFAIQYNEDGTTSFGVNDPDDAADPAAAVDRCPVVSDFMRYLVSVQLQLKERVGERDKDKARLENLIQAYAQSLVYEKTPAIKSEKLKKFISTPKTDDDALKDANDDFKKAEALPCGAEVDALIADGEPLLNEVSKTIKGVFEGERVKYLKGCKCKNGEKPGGGSGGVGRYEVQCSMNDKEQIAFTFKGTQKNATAFFSESEKAWDAKNRYPTTCAMERGPSARPCNTVDFNDGRSSNTYWVRLKKEKSIKVAKDFSEEADLFSAAQFEDPPGRYINSTGLYVDEAIAIGQLHRKSIGNTLKTPAELARVKKFSDLLLIQSNTEKLAAIAQSLAERTAKLADQVGKTFTDEKFIAACNASKAKAPPRDRGAAPEKTPKGREDKVKTKDAGA